MLLKFTYLLLVNDLLLTYLPRPADVKMTQTTGLPCGDGIEGE